MGGRIGGAHGARHGAGEASAERTARNAKRPAGVVVNGYHGRSRVSRRGSGTADVHGGDSADLVVCLRRPGGCGDKNGS